MENIFQGLIAILDESAKNFREETEKETEGVSSATEICKVWKDGKLVKTEKKRWENGKLVSETCKENKPGGIEEKTGCTCNGCKCEEGKKHDPMPESIEEEYAEKLKKVEEEVDKLVCNSKKLSEENNYLKEKLYSLEKENKKLKTLLDKIKGIIF